MDLEVTSDREHHRGVESDAGGDQKQECTGHQGGIRVGRAWMWAG